jgi:hypothetical protein
MATRPKQHRNSFRVGKNRAFVLMGKYIDCELDYGKGKCVRKLSASEIAEFQRVIALKIERKEHAAGVGGDGAGRPIRPEAPRNSSRASAASRRACV